MFDVATLGERGTWVLENRRVFAHCDKGFRTGSSVIRMETFILVAGTEFTYVSDLEQTNERYGIPQDD